MGNHMHDGDDMGRRALVGGALVAGSGSRPVRWARDLSIGVNMTRQKGDDKRAS